MQSVVYENYPSESVSLFADLKLPREEGIFIAEGEKIVSRLLQSKQEIISLYLTAEHFHQKRQLIDAHQQDRPAAIFIASNKAMEKIVGFTLHQGILAAGKVPIEPALKEVVDRTKRQLFVLLDTIADAENMGTLYRTAQAMGATAVIINNRCISPWIRRAVRVSMGAVFKLPTITADLVSSIAFLQDHGVAVFASEIADTTPAIWQADFSGSTAIVFGSEGHGITPEVSSACSGKVMIPMIDGVGSLNVGVAQGIMLYEVMRPRITG